MKSNNLLLIQIKEKYIIKLTFDPFDVVYAPLHPLLTAKRRNKISLLPCHVVESKTKEVCKKGFKFFSENFGYKLL